MTAIAEALRGNLTERQCWNTGTHAVLVTESMPHVHAPGERELRAEVDRLKAWGHKSSDEDGHCRHGVYVGGSGIDWMCGQCENHGVDEEIEALEQRIEEVTR